MGSPGHLQSTALGCTAIEPALSSAAAGFTITQSLSGLKFDGWFIDLTTDASATIVLGRGLTPASTIAAVADSTDMRSLETWPGFSDQHGFTALLPYAGAPGATQICAWLALSPAGLAVGSPLHCFTYQERIGVFSEAQAPRGMPLHVSVRNLPSGAKVAVNLRADPGYFVLPWTDPSVSSATADQAGAADVTIATSQIPPGRYVIAYHCTPDCPGGNLSSNQLIGGQPWSGSITWGPNVTIIPTISRGLSAVSSGNIVAVTGTGFSPGETVGVVVVPPLLNFEGFPEEIAATAYTEADAKGELHVSVEVAGLPLGGPHNQVIALDGSQQPVMATSFTAP